MVLRLAFDDDDAGRRWYLWASYRFTARELAVDRVELEIDSVFIPDEVGPFGETPDELIGEAIFEARCVS